MNIYNININKFIKKKIQYIFLASVLVFIFSSCSGPKDISEDDLKSPCVTHRSSLGGDLHDPCERRSPQENRYFV
ncbi:hypothetical protein Lyticum_00468 [Lyticum sinuosum]|uniref:Uncharacterized protein n=1 Tax=Lyticum sinuosum TaxID=1332059 RepID=A0AAE5AHL8_9RICK|nr:hypothetical protein [Lyticum sinuosum]